MIKNSNNKKNNNIFDRENKINRFIYIKLSNIKEKIKVFDSNVANHEIKGNNNCINNRNTMLPLSKCRYPRKEIQFKFNDQGIREKE